MESGPAARKLDYSKKTENKLTVLLRVLKLFGCRYPGPSLMIVGGLLLAGLAEIFGVLTLLPLLSLVTGEIGGTRSGVEAVILDIVLFFNLPVKLEVLLAFIVISVFVKACVTWVVMRYVGYMMARVQTEFRVELISALVAANWSYLIAQPAGRLVNAASTEASRASAAAMASAQLVTAGVQGLLYLASAFVVEPYVTLCAILAGLTIFLALMKFLRLAQRAGSGQTKSMNQLMAKLADGLQGLKPIKAMGRENHLVPILLKESRTLQNELKREVLSRVAMRTLQEPIMALFLAVGLYFALSHFTVSFAQILVMAILFWRSVGTVGTLQKNLQSVVVTESALWSIQGLTDEARSAREFRGGQSLPKLQYGIVFEKIFFSYGEKNVFSDFSMEIPAKSLTAVVGPSGVGKTTVADLVVGLQKPDGGKIKIDGISMSDIEMSNWRRQIGYVPQDTVLFNDTLAANLTFGDTDLTREEVEGALKAAEAWEFVTTLADGLETGVGERGQTLSGGQRQRLALARALIRKPRLLILDEATTGLDPEVEDALCQTLRKLSSSMTILAISHQPAIVAVADKIIRLGESGVRGKDA